MWIKHHTLPSPIIFQAIDFLPFPLKKLQTTKQTKTQPQNPPKQAFH